MKKAVLVGLTALALSSSAALANSFGLRLGAPLGVQYTIDDGIGRGTDLRIAGYVSPFYGVLGVGVQGDALVNRPLDGSPNLSLFYGGGANVQLVTGYGATAFGVGVQGTGGISYRLDPSISLFADLSVGLSFYGGGLSGYGYGGIAPTYGGALGINFRL